MRLIYLLEKDVDLDQLASDQDPQFFSHMMNTCSE